MLIWKYVPNLKYDNFTSNSLGFRGLTHNYVKNSTRIVFLGDSYTAGVEYFEDLIFPNQVQKKINNTEILNFGVTAYATDQEYLVLKEYVINYNPDIIILTVVPNDFRETYVKNLFYLNISNLVLDEENKAFHLSKLDKLFWKLSLNSQFFYMLQLRLGKNYGSFDYIFNDVTSGVFLKEDRGYNTDVVLFLTNETNEMKKSIELFSKLIEEMNYICKKHQTKFMIINLPIKMQFDGIMRGEKFNQDKFSMLLKKITLENDIYYLDLYPSFKNSNNPLSYYITEEYHLNEKGHTFVADEIYKKLIEENLI